MIINAVLVLLLTALHVSAQVSEIQYLGSCSTGNESDLESSISMYNTHTERLTEKFVSGFYNQSERLPHLRSIHLSQVVQRLRDLAPRRAAALFYAYAGRPLTPGTERLCIWLISPHVPRSFVHQSLAIAPNEIENLRTGIVRALGVTGIPGALRYEQSTKLAVEVALDRTRRAILPDAIVDMLSGHAIDSLIILPIFDFGSIPFAALPLANNKRLVDLVAVTIAPGFFVFLDRPITARTKFRNPLVVANTSDPDRTVAGELRAQAETMAGTFGVKFSPADATIQTVKSRLASIPRPELIYIAAHGRADAEHPLEGGMLDMLDGGWLGKDIARCDLQSTKPLVVLSACETGLGKNFEVGTIGLGRAWYQAGASNVIVSNWSVYQPSTHQILSTFACMLSSGPPDIALRSAMLLARNRGLDVANWAGFNVFGLPELPQSGDVRLPPPCGELGRD